MTKATRLCEANGCDRKHLAKGMCSYHYRIANPPKKDKPVECPTCGTVTMRRDPTRKDVKKATGFCSLLCRDIWRCDQPDDPMHNLGGGTKRISRLPSDHPVRQLIRADAARLQRRPSQQRGALRAAVEDGDWAAIPDIIERDVVKVDGCWLWSRQRNKGYGKVTIGTRVYFVHRIMMKAALNGELDPSMPVHHACAETLCCNPEHLQLVTQRENMAEMLERKYYTTRIATLETALRESNPWHPALTPWLVTESA